MNDKKNLFNFPAFPIGLIIAIGIGMIVHITSPRNNEILKNQQIAKTSLSKADKEHIIIFLSPKNNFKVFDFFPSTQWNNYKAIDRISYTAPVISSSVVLYNITIQQNGNLGRRNIYANCELTPISSNLKYSVNCKFNPISSNQRTIYSYKYDYTLNPDLSVKVDNVLYTHPLEDLDYVTDIDKEFWTHLIFWAIILQYFLIPEYYRRKNGFIALLDKILGKENYDNFPPPKVSGKNPS